MVVLGGRSFRNQYQHLNKQSENQSLPESCYSDFALGLLLVFTVLSSHTSN